MDEEDVAWLRVMNEKRKGNIPVGYSGYLSYQFQTFYVDFYNS